MVINSILICRENRTSVEEFLFCQFLIINKTGALQQPVAFFLQKKYLHNYKN